MKLRHNKKRNTVFLYESLVKELTKSVVQNNAERKKIVLSILKEYFKKDSVLGKELSLYKDVLESRELDFPTAEKILHEAKMVYWSGFKNQKVYDEQSEVITKVNRDLSKNFNNVSFNKIFDQNRIENVYDSGYSTWMEENKVEGWNSGNQCYRRSRAFAKLVRKRVRVLQRPRGAN